MAASAFLNTFLLSLRVYGTPWEVIDGFHRRLRVLDKRITFEPARLHLQFRYMHAFRFSSLLLRKKSTCFICIQQYLRFHRTMDE